MKSKKLSGLTTIPLVGLISLVGTPIAFADECSALTPCVSNSLSAAVSLPSDALSSVTVEVTAPPVPSVTAPITQTLDDVTAPVDAIAAPVADSISKITAPITDNAPVPVVPVVPTKPIPTLPGESGIPLEETAAVEPATSVPEENNAEIVAPADTKSASTPIPPEIHNASADSGGLSGLMMLTPNLVDFQSAAVHSSQGTQTKVRNSGGFGFGHVNPVDNPVGFAGMAFAYIIVLGSGLSLAVKRGFVPNFRALISRI